MAENFTAKAPAGKKSVGKNSASKKQGPARLQTNPGRVNPQVRLIGPGHEVCQSSDPAVRWDRRFSRGGGLAVEIGFYRPMPLLPRSADQYEQGENASRYLFLFKSEKPKRQFSVS